MAGAGVVNMDKFEEYFQRADSDRDGKISGVEAVTFLQGSNLPRPVLAQIWAHVDQTHTGFLSRPEFYNALRLVTVAQSKRELTPDIVKAALYSAASTKIPPPQINVAVSPLPQSSLANQPSPQNFGFRGPVPSTTTAANQQFGTNAGTTQQFRPMPSPTGMNQQRGMTPSSSGVNQQFRPLQPATTMNQQFGQFQPPSTGMNQQFGQTPSSTNMNQQFGQPPLSANMNQQFGQPPLSTNMNQQFGQPPSSTNVNQQFFPPPGNQIRPPLSMPSTSASHPSPTVSRPNIPGAMASPGLLNSNKGGPVSTGPSTQNNLVKGPSLSSSPVALNPQDILSAFSATAAKDPKVSVSSGNGPVLDDMFAGDVFSANQSSSWKVSSAPLQPAISLPTSSAVVPVTASSQPPAKPDPFETLQSNLMKPSVVTQAAPTPSLLKSNPQGPTQVASSVLPAGVQAGVGRSTAEQSQAPWPKMTRAGIQKYAKVFMEVDADRDGKITGDQARNLFLSWKLPREVLKQVWDLSDQDSDSMLSLREFCVALYLMERYREGRSLPSVLPNSIMLDEVLSSSVGPPTAYGGTGWGPSTGIRPQQGFHGAQTVTPAGIRPPMQQVVSQPDGSMQFNQRSVGGPTIDNFHANQLHNGEANTLHTKEQEAAGTSEGVDKEKLILDSREKLEFYRTKMQDLILYKSRCDNRLNEITERARADKAEAESLEKKYQDKYKQVAEIHSKLTIEEAAFREVQARKTELEQAIIKMEQGGSADGILQVRADRIQSDLEELTKAFADRCKKHSLEIKPPAMIELPSGWQPGIPEVAAIWDEDWDKFEDEGFSFDVTVPENEKSTSDPKENSPPTRSLSPDLISNSVASEKLFADAFETESVYSADESKSPEGSPGRETRNESPSEEYSVNHFRKSSVEDADTRRSFDEPSWGNFDNNDDIDSVWGFNAKDPDHGKHDEKYFFGSNDFGASPEQNDSPHSDSAFQKSSPFNFEDSSVPGTPPFRADNSPRYSEESKDQFFDNFSRFDSFSTHDQGSSPRRDNFSRFDSMNSTSGFNHSSNYSFDDSDPFGSSGPFKVSSSETPPREKF